MFDYTLRVGEGGLIKLPDDVLQHHDLKPGSKLELIERPDGVLEIRPLLEDTEHDDWFFPEDSEMEISITRSASKEKQAGI